MAIDSTDNNEGNSFEYRLKEVSDEEIISILRFREHYQPQAVKAAIREAIKRGIIESIDDLERDEFKPQALSKSLFPVSFVERQNESVLKSLCRICYLFGIIPVIFGILQVVACHLTLGIISLTLGISMAYITFKLEKERKPLLSQLLLIFNIPAWGYLVYRLTFSKNFSKMDIIVALVVIIVLLYTTLYLNKLIVHLNKNRER